jgi:hypothetical protein
MVLPPAHPGGTGRVLEFVPVGRAKHAALDLRDRLQPLVPSWSLDHCWIPGRDHRTAVKLAEIHASVRPFWLTLDIVSFFASIPQRRMWWIVKGFGDVVLADDVRHFVENIGCEHGIPEGCAFSPSLANLYLAAIDRRWHRNGVRVGDNIACADPGRMAAELLDIGLRVTHTSNLLTRVDGSWPPSAIN